MLWWLGWWLLFRPSPRIAYVWRVLVLKLFGAQITWQSRVDPSVKIWAPWNLSIGQDASIGHHVDVYNLERVSIGSFATVSQYAFLCTGSHDIGDPRMSLTASPILIADSAWICAKAFVGPGVNVKQGAVVAACAVAVRDVNEWTVSGGNPAREIGRRELRDG